MANRTPLAAVFCLPLVACATVMTDRGLAEPQTEVFRSVESTDTGGRITVTEFVAPAQGTCQTTVRETTVISAEGDLRERSVEQIRCGILESKIVERPGPDGIPIVEELSIDQDHDGEFDVRWRVGDPQPMPARRRVARRV